MIDTICLRIPKDKIKTIDLSDQGVPYWNLHSRADQYAKFVKNPSKRDLDSGLYFPRLTGYKRRISGAMQENIKIEFSVPKLLFYNNLDEVEDKDFERIVSTLKERLNTMGVIVSEEILNEAEVSSVHFSKNIELLNGYTVVHVISEISKANIKKTFDFSKTRFSNEGQSIYAHATTHELTIYDKLADMAKGKKRSIDKDQPPQQRSLFGELKQDNLQILRIEIRIGQKKKLNQLLSKLGHRPDPTFRDIFSSRIAQSIVSDYWNKIIVDRSFGTFSLSSDPIEVLSRIIRLDARMKPKQVIYLIGLHLLSRDKQGIRGFRRTITPITNDRTWYRIAADIKISNDLASKGVIKEWASQIQKSIDEFKTYKHKTTYPQKEIGM